MSFIFLHTQFFFKLINIDNYIFYNKHWPHLFVKSILFLENGLFFEI